MEFTSHPDDSADPDGPDRPSDRPLPGDDDARRGARRRGERRGKQRGNRRAEERPTERKMPREEAPSDTVIGHALGIEGAEGQGALLASRAPLPRGVTRAAVLSVIGLLVACLGAGPAPRGIGWLLAAAALPWWARATGRFQATLRSGGRHMGRGAAAGVVLLGLFIVVAIALAGYLLAASLVRAA